MAVWNERLFWLSQHPLATGIGLLLSILMGLVFVFDLSGRILAWMNPPPVRAALTDFTQQNGQIRAALTVEAEALTGSYAWACAPVGAVPVDVLPIARSTALRFSVPGGTPQTFVYLQLAGGDLLEVAVDLFAGSASDAAVVSEEDQRCG